MAGMPVKSRDMVNLIEKKRSIFDSDFENELLKMLLFGLIKRMVERSAWKH